MKFKKLLGGGLLAAVLALGVGAGLAVHSESKETLALESNEIRVNALLSPNVTSWWYGDNAITCFKGADSYIVQLQQDPDIPTTFTIKDVTYDVWTGIIDVNSVSYNSSGILRMKSDKSVAWNGNWGIWKSDLIEGKTDNTFIVNSGEQSENVSKWGVWHKLVTYYGVTDYSDLSQAEKDGLLTYNGAPVSDPTVVPTGTSFAHWCTDAALENEWTGSVTSDLTLYAKYASNVFDITKKIYHDDSFISESADHVEEGQSYTPATPADEEGYIFKGWYEYDSINDKPSSTPVTTIASVTSNQTICGVYASRGAYTHDGYVYYVADIEGDAQTPNTIYSYGGHNEFGSWPGTAITSVGTDVHGSLGFEGYASEGYTRHIYKIPYTTAFSDTHIIIVYNGGKSSGGDQTADMTLVNKGTYWWSSTTGNTDAGSAIDFLIEAEDVRNEAKYGTLNYSVCGISKADATTLVGKYDNLGGGAAYVDRSYTYTYDPSKSAEEQEASKAETAVQYSLIIAKLREIASGNGPSTNTKGIFLFGDIDNSTPIMLVVIISVVSLTAVGGYIFLKRRKEN